MKSAFRRLCVSCVLTAASFLPLPALSSDDVKARLFADPSNIDINLEYLQSQLADGNLKGAAATLQRVLLIDPSSKLAKVLSAEVQLQLGNLDDARLNLESLLSEKDTPDDMRARAAAILQKIEAATKRLSFGGSLGLAVGQGHNVLGASKGPFVTYSDAQITNGASHDSANFVDYDLMVNASYKLPSYVARTLTGSVGLVGRDFSELSQIDSDTVFSAIGFAQGNLSLGLNAYATEVDGEVYSIGRAMSVSYALPLASKTDLRVTFSGGDARFVDYGGSSVAKLRDNTRFGGQIEARRQVSLNGLPALVGLKLGYDEVDAEEDFFSLATPSLSVSFMTAWRGFGFKAQAGFYDSEYDAPDPLVSQTLIRKDERSQISGELSMSGDKIGLQKSQLYLSGNLSDVRSTINNFTKTTSELRLGIRRQF